MPTRFVLFGLCLVCCASGCRSPLSGGEEARGNYGPFGKIGNPLDWGVEEEEGPREGVPERVVVTWVDTVRHQSGGSSERGFGGRLYFYDREPDPIAVEGRLVVYAFEEEGREPTDHKPTRRYVFPVHQLARHQSESDLGPSYSVWLPWGGVDGPPTKVSLIARFEPTRGGGLVVSDQATEVLPGQGLRSPDAGTTMLASAPAPGAVRQAGFAEQTAETPTAGKAAPPKQRLSTTTIRLGR